MYTKGYPRTHDSAMARQDTTSVSDRFDLCVLGCDAYGRRPGWCPSSGANRWYLIPAYFTWPAESEKHNYLYWEFHEQGGRQAIRKEDWKLVRYKVLDTVNITTELYNLRTDLEEKNNVAAAHPEVVKELLDQLKIIRDPNTDFPFIEKLH